MQAASEELLEATARGESTSEEDCTGKHSRDCDRVDDCAGSLTGLTVEDEQFLTELTQSLGENEAQTLTKRKKRRLLQLSGNQRQAITLRAKITQCARSNDIVTAISHYSLAKESNSSIDKDTFVILVALTSGFVHHNHSQQSFNQGESQGNIEVAMTVLRDAQQAGVELPEASFSSVIRCCGAQGNVSEGLELLQELKNRGLTPKHRSYSPLIAAASMVGDVETGFKLWDEMLGLELMPLEKDYIAVFRLCVVAQDADRFYSIMEQFMDEIDVPSQESWPVLRQWFVQASLPEGDNLFCREMVNISASDSIIDQPEYSADGTTCVCVSKVTTEGVCLANGDTLASIELAPEDRGQLLQKIETFVLERGRYQKDGVWERFKDWCSDAKQREQYNVIIDGANVGYHKQNYAGAPSHVSYDQIDAMARFLKANGYKPVIVLHRRHLSSKTLPDSYKPMVQRWQDEDMLYITPHGNNDDWFWLFAAVSWGVHVITNDEMRDHDFNMLAPKWFSRWRERHACKFSFGKKAISYAAVDGSAANVQNAEAKSVKFDHPKNTEDDGVIDLVSEEDEAAVKSQLPEHKFVASKKVALTFPTIYSQRSQRTTRGWYFPAQDTDRWLCICRVEDMRMRPESSRL